ncbi:MAG: hypothetical protein IPK59_11375 [Rhodospirillaceae bacterium]|nr:hypothetical protein [Rhodospirillaceae bacterium]
MLPYAVIRPVHLPPRHRLALAALVCVTGMTAPGGMRAAWAGECAAAAGPAGAAGTSALYGELAATVSAEPLSVDITAQAIGGSCVWVYEVKVLTVSGSVALLDFDLVDLDLKRVQGPAEDPDIAKLMTRLDGAGQSGDPIDDDSADSVATDSSGSSGSGGDDSGGDDSGGEGSGSGNSGSGDSDGGDSDGGDSSGGEGGDGGGGEGSGDGGGGGGGGEGGGGGGGGEGGGDD